MISLQWILVALECFRIVPSGVVAFSLSMSSSLTSHAPYLKSVLQKPSKVLTVGVEICDALTNSISSSEISLLSMQLRKSKVSSIWVSQIDAFKEFALEQATAKGDFPGALPVVYFGKEVAEAIKNGASAIVLDAVDDHTVLGDDDDDDFEIIWKVHSLESLESVIEKTEKTADAFWVEDESIIPSMPNGSLIIMDVNPMQVDGNEIDEAKELKKTGCSSILVRQACVGDTEDLPYAQYLVDGLTSKASSEFKFSGLTGSTNGHFGGIQATGSPKWRRRIHQ